MLTARLSTSHRALCPYMASCRRPSNTKRLQVTDRRNYGPNCTGEWMRMIILFESGSSNAPPMKWYQILFALRSSWHLFTSACLCWCTRFNIDEIYIYSSTRVANICFSSHSYECCSTQSTLADRTHIVAGISWCKKRNALTLSSTHLCPRIIQRSISGRNIFTMSLWMQKRAVFATILATDGWFNDSEHKRNINRICRWKSAYCFVMIFVIRGRDIRNYTLAASGMNLMWGTHRTSHTIWSEFILLAEWCRWRWESGRDAENTYQRRSIEFRYDVWFENIMDLFKSRYLHSHWTNV